MSRIVAVEVEHLPILSSPTSPAPSTRILRTDGFS
jgi:hypothetical protein